MSSELDKEYKCDKNGLGLVEDALKWLVDIRDNQDVPPKTKYAVLRSIHDLEWFLENEIYPLSSSPCNTVRVISVD